MVEQFGIIGVGNMGEAILRGMVLGNVLPAEQIHIFDISTEKCKALQTELHVTPEETLSALSNACDMLLLAVKPDVCESVLTRNRSAFDQKALVSIVTGWSGARLSDILPAETRILHVMPNTPALVGEGMCVFEQGDTLTEDERAFAMGAFQAIGRTASVKPSLMSAVTGVSGSGPAYVYMFIEALADGGVRAGLPRNKAYEFAAQTVLGAAKMVLETKQHPGRLKDNVCSPGGTTIEAVAALEEHGMRSAVIEAVRVCVEKAEKMDHI